MTKIAFLFPGQGAQTVGMGQRLAESLPAARDLFDRAQAVLGYDLAELCFQGPAEDLDTTAISQPGLFVTSLAALETLRDQTPEVVLACEAVAGLSLGEYTALVFAGVMDFEAGLRLVQQRGQAMQEAADRQPSGMVSILGLQREQVESICDRARQPGEVLGIANFLCPGNIVVSGHNASCEKAAEIAEAEGAMKAMPLAVAGAFHTELMEPSRNKLAGALSEVSMRSPAIPVISNVDAQPHDNPEEIRELLVRQLVGPVLWEDSMRWFLGRGFDSFYEVGPGRVLRGLLRRMDRSLPCENIAC